MEESTKVTLIANKTIAINGVWRNIHDISAIIVNEDGQIIDYKRKIGA